MLWTALQMHEPPTTPSFLPSAWRGTVQGWRPPRLHRQMCSNQQPQHSQTHCRRRSTLARTHLTSSRYCLKRSSSWNSKRCLERCMHTLATCSGGGSVVEAHKTGRRACSHWLPDHGSSEQCTGHISLSAWLRCQKMLLMLLERSSVSSCCAGAAECATGEARMVP